MGSRAVKKKKKNGAGKTKKKHKQKNNWQFGINAVMGKR